MSATTREVIEFDDLDPYLLLKNGNYLYKVPFRDGWAVLKVYYGSRGFWDTLGKSLGNWAEGQTSYFPLTRLANERDCLELWRKHGFRTFRIYDDVEVRAPKCPSDGYLLLEYVDAPTLENYMQDPSVDLEQRFATWRRWLVEWEQRHTVCEREREPKLMHENGDPGHVMLIDDGFLWFDFEMVFRSRRNVREHLGHEIVQYLWMALRHTPPDMHERLIRETVEHYPNRERMRFAPDVFLNHPRALMRMARGIDAKRRKGRKPSSKYALARRLKDAVEAADAEGR